jgi:FkbM family methyltransferase
MYDLIKSLYRRLFCGKAFYKYNKILFDLSKHGIGILNFENSRVSGEAFFVERFKTLKNGTVFDIGAHMGDYSELLRRTNDSLDIYCFEPHPVTFAKLQTHARKGVNVYNLAIGNTNGEFKLFDYKDKDGSEHATVYKEVIESIHKGSPIEHTVQMKKLDDFIAENKIPVINLLKIDAEGHELDILKGCENSLRNNIIEIIHFEFNEMNVVSRVFFKDFWDMLPDFYFYRMLPDALIRIEEYNPLLCELFAFQNIAAIRKDLHKPGNG